MTSPARYRRPDGELVDALQFIGNFNAVESFAGGDAEWTGRLVVATRQGALLVDKQDWVVRDSTGRYTAVKPTEFAGYTPIGSTPEHPGPPLNADQHALDAAVADTSVWLSGRFRHDEAAPPLPERWVDR